jgi:hypothetical protein
MWGSFFLIMMIMKIPRISQLLATSTILSMEDESMFFAQTAVRVGTLAVLL